MDQLLTMEALIAFLTLTALELVLGIDNIIFIRMTRENSGSLGQDESC